MNIDTRLAAFVEYVVRPMTEDVRQILQQLATLNIGITQDTIKQIILTLGLWHLLSECIRAISYIMVTWILCQALQTLLLRSSFP